MHIMDLRKAPRMTGYMVMYMVSARDLYWESSHFVQKQDLR